MSDRKRAHVSMSAKILVALRDVPRATVPKIAEDLGKDRGAIYRHLRGLLEVGLVEEAGTVPGRNACHSMPVKTYRIARLGNE